MEYLNTYKLIDAIMRGEKPDAKALLAEVDKQKVLSALKRGKHGLPKPVPYTDQPIEEINLSAMPQRDKERLWAIYGRLQNIGDNHEHDLKALFAFREKYPKVPCIYNYISVIYQNTKQWEKLLNILDETSRLFPDYLFGKMALAEYYYQRSDIGKIPLILNHKFEIYMHYPETELFHVSEVRAFYAIVGMYYAGSNQVAGALRCYFILEEIDPDHLSTSRLGYEIVRKEVDNFRQKMNKAQLRDLRHRR